MQTNTIEFDANDFSELFHAFKNRGDSDTKLKIGRLLREIDKQHGRTTPTEYWYFKGDESMDEGANLMDYQTGCRIREATQTELTASLEAEKTDGGCGVIDVDGRKCYVIES